MVEHVLELIKSQTNLFASLLGVAISLIAYLISHFYKKQVEKRFEAEKELFKSIENEFLSEFTAHRYKTIENQPEDIQASSEILLERMERQILERVSAVPGVTKEQVKEEVRNEMLEFKTRIEKMEKRFPDEAQLEKISSINDAILSERIDHLSKKVEGLEGKLLSRWDVATIVSTIIGGIFAVVAATYAVINFITNLAK